MKKGSKLGHPSPKKGLKIPYNPHPKMKGLTPWNKGLKGVQVSVRKGKRFPNQHHDKQFKKGCKPWNFKKGETKPKCLNCNKQLSSLYAKYCRNCYFKDKGSGKNHYNYQGGITPENVKIRTSIEMILWRNSVFARDGYTDQKTGVKGEKLVAHHILNFSSHPELRFAIDNGITLSDKSHIEFHKIYGKRNNTREQLEEFLGSVFGGGVGFPHLK